MKLSGSGFWIYSGLGAQIEWALINFFVQEHLKDGYEFILPPHILSYQCGYVAGQFPKFGQDDVFFLQSESAEEKSPFLLPTAETALASYHRDEILDEDELPKKYFAFTPCFRKEAGSYRTHDRGTVRGHQFDKVEIFQYTLAEKSDETMEELVAKAERLVQLLGLHYRVVRLAAGDCSAAMARTFDVEVWMPSIESFQEVSSVSNAREFQARRGNTRVRRAGTKSNEYAHTLNASGLATSRLLPAMLESFQNDDGSVSIPQVLRPWIGRDRLE